MEATVRLIFNARSLPAGTPTTCNLTAGLVRLCAETLDSTADDPALIVEVQTVDGRSMATLRGCVSALETISESRQTRNGRTANAPARARRGARFVRCSVDGAGCELRAFLMEFFRISEHKEDSLWLKRRLSQW